MAKKIRFPLKMKNGAEVRSLEELQENFDLESVLGYFADGKLQTWLADRYYNEKAEAVSALSVGMPDLNAQLCDILGIEYISDDDETDLELIQRRNEKLKILSEITADKDILDNVDLVAMDQDELFDILDESPEKVYLYGDKFEIPFGKNKIQYIGVNKPLVVLENDKNNVDYQDSKITFQNVGFEEKSYIPFYEADEYLNNKDKYKQVKQLEEDAANGNADSQFELAERYHHGINIKMDLIKAVEYYTLAADQGHTEANYWLGILYYYGKGIAENKTLAYKYFKRAASQGHSAAKTAVDCYFSDFYKRFL